MKCGEKGSSFRAIVLLSIILGSFWPCLADAAITATGNIDPNYNGTDLWNVNGVLTVGVAADGTLEITNGSQVITGPGRIAAGAGSTASVRVTGVGSRWENAGGFYVGDTGNGTLTIDGGGSLLSGGGFVGSEPGSVGHLIITGPGTRWQGAMAQVIHVADALTASADETGRTEIIVTIGRHGTGDVTISNGAMVTADGGLVYLGYWSDGIGTLTVTGPNSVWVNTGEIHVGYMGTGTLVISDGGSVTSAGALIGGISAVRSKYGPGSVLVTGPNSLWRTGAGAYGLAVGGGGSGDLTISAGGRVESLYASVSSETAGQARVTVMGQDSAWELERYLVVGSGSKARYGDLLIEDGGRVSDTDGYVGWKIHGVGTVIVAGPNSIWTNSGSLYIGGDSLGDGGQGRLTVRDAGLVEAHDLTIWSQGTIDGDGMLRASKVINHGIIRPGNSIGTMTIDGSLTMDSNSVLETEIDNSGHSDKLAVTGNVEIVHGTVKVVPTEVITAAQQYTIMEANGVSGKFDGVDATLLHVNSPIRIAELGYEPNAVLLNVTPSTFNDPAFGQTKNERQVGSVLQQMADNGGNTITSVVGKLHTYADVRYAYDQLSGQTRAPLGFVTVEGLDRHLDVVSNRLHGAAGAFASGLGLPGMLAMAEPAAVGITPGGGGVPLGGPLSIASNMSMAAGPYMFAVGNGTPYLADQPWGIWGRGYGLHGDRETSGGISGYKYTTYGTCFGLDYRFSPQWLLGITTGFSRGDVDHARSDDAADIDATHLGFYGSYEQPGGYVDFIADHADLDLKTRRYVDVVDERLDGDFGGTVAGGYIEAGLKRSLGASWMLQPLASFQIVWANIDGFTESGGVSRLTFDDQQFDSYKGSLGAKAIRLLYEHADGSRAAVEFRGRWLHEFGDVRSTIRTNFVSDPSLAFSVTDAAAPRDSALLGVGLDAWFGRAMRGFFDYDIEANRDHALHIFSAGLQYRW